MKVNPTVPVPPAAIRAAGDFRALLRAGVLPRLGLTDVGSGSRLVFELAVRATLNELARFAALARGGHVVAAKRWRLLGEDLLRLHRIAAGACESQVRG
jgi:hypothetical protein